MNHPLLTQAEKARDGVLIGLEADTRERRVKALEAAHRAAQNLVRDLERELEVLNA